MSDIYQKKKLPNLTSTLSYVVLVKDVKDVIIDLNIMFLALSFVLVLAIGVIYKCMLLIGSYIFLDYLRSIFSSC